MILSPDFVRPLASGEEDEVDLLLRAAFPTGGQAALVRALRKSGAMAGEMVLPASGALAGYAGLSAMVAPKGWLCLGPVAILPDHQGRRWGKRLVGMVTEWASQSGATLLVTGPAPFFEKMGFSQARAARLTGCLPSGATLLIGPGNTVPAAALTYPAAFVAM